MTRFVPKGGLVVSRSLYQVSFTSYNRAAPTRSVSLPVPLGFHTKPTRGAKFFFCPFHMASGIPAAPLKNSRGGAFGWTLIIWPARNTDSLNEGPPPDLSGSENDGSQRRPKFNVTFLDMGKVS